MAGIAYIHATYGLEVPGSKWDAPSGGQAEEEVVIDVEIVTDRNIRKKGHRREGLRGNWKRCGG